MFFLELLFTTALILAVPSAIYLAGRRFAPRLFRRVAYDIHLWLGIVSGLILFVVCLSGTLLTFKTETIMFLERDRYYVNVPEQGKPKTLEELVPMLENAENGKVVRVTTPETANQALIVNIRKNDDGKSRAKIPSGMPAMHAMLGTAYLVDPYTGESLGPQRSATYMFFMMLQFLHRFLLLPIRMGQIVVGSATLIFIVLIVGGLFLWLPAKITNGKSWLPGLKVRSKSGWSRFVYDAHNTLGFYALLPLMVMALTGPVISFTWYRDTAGKVLGTKPFEKSFEKPVHSDVAKNSEVAPTLDELVGKMNGLSSRKGMTRVYLPDSPLSGVRIQKTGSGFCRLAATDQVQFDRYSGEVLKSDLFDDYSFGEKVSTLIFPLHNGEIFGTASKIVYFVTCLIATTLPITGVVLWIRKLRTRRRTRLAKQTAEIMQKRTESTAENPTLEPSSSLRS